MKLLRNLQISIFLSLFLMMVNDVLAETSLESKVAKIENINQKLQSKKYDDEDLTEWTHLTINVKSDADLCISNKNIAVDDLIKSIDGLGEKVEGEDPGLASIRQTLIDEKELIEQEAAKCNAYILVINDVEAALTEAKLLYLESKYLKKQPNIIALIEVLIDNPDVLLSDSADFISDHSGVRDIDMYKWGVGVAISLFMLFVSWRIKRLFGKIESRKLWGEGFLEKLYRAALTTGACMAPWLLMSFSIFLFLFIATIELKKTLFITQFSFAITLYFLAQGVSRLFLSPVEPAKQFMGFPEDITKNVYQRLKVLLLTGLVGYSAFYTVFSDSLNESNLQLVRYVYSLFLVVNLVWIIHVLSKSHRFPRLSLLARLVNAILLLTLIVEWVGYFYLAFSIRGGVLGTFIILILFSSVAKAFQFVFDVLDKGEVKWAKKLHKKLGVESGNKIPGLIWFRFSMAIMLWGGFAVLIISIWDFNGSVLEQLKSYLINGFTIGEIRLVPGRILWALIIFAVFLSLTGWIKSQLENKWLLMTNIDAGARDAMATIIGYILFIVSVLVGLSAAGFDFSNIAIVAGALSVGIGFGLQNIVNNFVSGLILLFERPIRKGDWVEVGGTTGFVRNIQIRSTLIRTFDNSDVIVPNSELISNQVTNWMLSSNNGRAIIPIGVAYGTDVVQVRDILLEVAKDNEKLIQVGDSKPKVLFREFGDSSLNFELRVFLKEVSGRLGMISELNFAIEKAFREANIEIPFPQRDLHVKSMPNPISDN